MLPRLNRRARSIEGRATFTIVMSRTTMSCTVASRINVPVRDADPRVALPGGTVDPGAVWAGIWRSFVVWGSDKQCHYDTLCHLRQTVPSIDCIGTWQDQPSLSVARRKHDARSPSTRS